MKTVLKVFMEFLYAVKLACQWHQSLSKVWRFIHADCVLQKEIQGKLEAHKISRQGKKTASQAKGEH